MGVVTWPYQYRECGYSGSKPRRRLMSRLFHSGLILPSLTLFFSVLPLTNSFSSCSIYFIFWGSIRNTNCSFQTLHTSWLLKKEKYIPFLFKYVPNSPILEFLFSIYPFICFSFQIVSILFFLYTLCPRSSYPFYIVTYYMKWVINYESTSWTHSTYIIRISFHLSLFIIIIFPY